MEATARARYVRITPTKIRRVIDLIRGRHVEEARRILQFSPLGAAHTVAKVLNSAVANAEQTPGIIPENLLVKTAFVDEGPTLKRFRPRAYGRAARIRKRTSHITLVVQSIEEPAALPPVTER
jgi:large subunit ribosomal protein L22